jgi:DUF2075 family protein
MIVYQQNKQGFLDDVFNGVIASKILSSFESSLGRSTGKNEVKSWENSLERMHKVLADPEIPSNCGVAIEYNIPQSGKRVDFILTGLNDQGNQAAIIIELKQWSEAQKTDQDGVVITFVGGNHREVAHPSYQAWSYAALMRDFNENLHDGTVGLHPCAYLHNFPSHDLTLVDPFYEHHVQLAPLYLQQDAAKLRGFIKQYVRKGDDGQTLYTIENGRIRPSKMLADKLSSLLKGNEEFIMIDDQKVVLEKILHATKMGRKEVLIVDGGPGTGKTVVAINALVKILAKGKNAQYLTKNAAPRAVYQAKLEGSFRRSHISNLFKGSGSYTGSPANDFDVLLADEAHRMNEKSGLYGNLGDNQIKEVVNAAKCSVFFIDEAQRVALKDIGTKGEIEKWAHQAGAKVTHLKLESQFRCNGADGYLAWLDNTLQIRETANKTLEGINYDFRVVDSPTELRRLIEEKNAVNNKSRMVAGYCWDWKSKKDPNAYDIIFPKYDFKAKWNLTEDGSLWITKPESVKEIGCIHTCQGLEVDYIGVIIGKDLLFRDGEVLVNPKARSRGDQTLKGYKSMPDTDETRETIRAIIKNTYRTLMTRGMKGCYVWCEDAETNKYLSKYKNG